MQQTAYNNCNVGVTKLMGVFMDGGSFYAVQLFVSIFCLKKKYIFYYVISKMFHCECTVFIEAVQCVILVYNTNIDQICRD